MASSMYEEATVSSDTPCVCREIRVHSLDGHVSRFAVSDPQRDYKLLDHVYPERVFSPQNILIQGDTAVSLFPCAAVIRIDFIANRFPDWAFNHNLSDVVEISESEFQLLHAEAALRLQKSPPQTGESFHTFAGATLANGDRIFLRLALVKVDGTSLDLAMMVHRLVSPSSVTIRRRDGGAILLNSSHIVRLSLDPELPDIPGAWRATLLP